MTSSMCIVAWYSALYHGCLVTWCYIDRSLNRISLIKNIIRNIYRDIDLFIVRMNREVYIIFWWWKPCIHCCIPLHWRAFIISCLQTPYTLEMKNIYQRTKWRFPLNNYSMESIIYYQEYNFAQNVGVYELLYRCPSINILQWILFE